MKNTILILAILFSLILSSQERVNRSNLQFDKQSKIIKDVKGWKYDEYSGSWDSSSYLILNLTTQNINNIQFKTLNFNSKTYYILIIQNTKSAYEYPEIEVGFYIYKNIDYFIYSSEEFNKLKQLKDSTTLKTNLVGYWPSKYNSRAEKIILDYIQKQLLDSENESVDNFKKEDMFTYIFPIKKVKLKNKIVTRFFLPIQSWDLRKSLNVHETRLSFDKQYFEMDFNEFKKLIIN